MKLSSRFLVAALSISPLTTPYSSNAASFDPIAFDFNGNGKIDKGTEADALLISLNKGLQRTKKKSSKVEISSKPAPTQHTALDAEIPAGKRVVNTGIFLGRSLNELDLLSVSEIVDLTPEEGAVFSYTHDFTDKNDTFVAEGVLYLGILDNADPSDPRNHPDPENTVALNEGWLFGTAFNVVDDDQPGHVVDQLNFFAGYQLLAGGGPIDANILRAWLRHDGDTEFKSSVLSASLEWYPYNFAPLPMNVPQNIFGGLIRYSPKVTVNGQVSAVLDPGDKPELEDQDEIYGIGGELGLDLWMYGQPVSAGGDVDRTPWSHAYVGYRNAWGHLGDKDDYQGLFVAQADVFLGSPNIALTAAYRDGAIPYSGEDIQDLTVGLSVLLAPSN